MDWNELDKGLLLSEFQNGTRVPLPNVHVGYGPFASMNEAKTVLTEVFDSLSNVPRGYTFCIIENGKPQEYWNTRDREWYPEKKNTSSSSVVTIDGIKFRKTDTHIQVSTDGGNSWENLVDLDDIRGRAGAKGDKGDTGDSATADLSKIKIRVNRGVTTVEGEQVYSYTIDYTTDGINWLPSLGPAITVNPSGGGEGSGGSGGIIGIATWAVEDGGDNNKYWTITIDGVTDWLLDDQGNKVRANGIDGRDGTDYSGTGSYSSFKSIVFKRYTPTENNPKPATPSDDEGTYNDPVPRASGWSDGVPAVTEGGPTMLWMTTRWFFTDPALMGNSHWTEPQRATDTADIDIQYSNAPLDTPLNVLGFPYTAGHNYPANPDGWYDADEVSDDVLLEANWMAIAKIQNGVLQNWSRFKIRGERGDSTIAPAATFKTHVFRRSSSVMSPSDPQYDAARAAAGEIRLPSSEWPTGGSYASPIPTNTEVKDGEDVPMWHDGIPGGTERIWESVAVVISDSDVPPTWSEPALVADNEKWDFEWCDLETLPPGFGYPSRTSPDDANPGKTVGDPWYDEPDNADEGVPHGNPVWKAERKKISAYEYDPDSPWFVYRIKGERGTNGTSIQIKGGLFGVYGPYDQSGYLNEARNYYNQNASTLGSARYAIFGTSNNWTKIYSFTKSGSTTTYTDITSEMEVGDMYLYEGEGYVWDGDNFFNIGRIQGDKGEAEYVHIKYSHDPLVLTNPAAAQFSENGGETPAEYIGIRVDTNPTDPTDLTLYKWKRWKGEDGWGYEYIFMLTSKNAVDSQGNPIAPDTPKLAQCTDVVINGVMKTFQDDDYVPTHLGWSDDPESPHKEYPYCWVVFRQKIDNVWTPYKGTGSSNGTKAALFSMWTSKGRGISNVTEMYALSDSREPNGYPTIGSSAWSESYPAYDSNRPTFIWLWNYEIITYDDDSTPKTTEPACIGGLIAGKGILRIEEYYYASPTDVLRDLPNYDYYRTNGRFMPNPTEEWTRTFQRVNKDYPYLWNYEVITFEKTGETLNPDTQDLPDSKYHVTEPVIIAEYVYTDIEYLLTVFRKVEGDENTAYLGGLIGVIDDNQKIQAMLNATDIGKDEEHGKLYIAAGLDGLNGTDNEQNEKAQNATFKVYEDGHVSMKSAEIQGYLTQHFRRVHDVTKYIIDVGNGTTTRFLDKSKLSNALLLGWNTLSFSDSGESISFNTNYQVNLSTYLSHDNAGRVLFSNQFYVSKSGIVFSNNNYGKTLLKGNFILPDGTITESNFGVALYGGWIEVVKVSSLDADMKLIVPQLTSMDNLYIVLAWGGTVRFTGTKVVPNVNSGQAIVTDANALIGFDNEGGKKMTITIQETENIRRLSEFNKYVVIRGSSTDAPLYVVVPRFDVDTWYDEEYHQIQYNILFAENHRRVIFKVEAPGANTPDAEVPNLPSLTTLLDRNTGFEISGNATGFSAYYNKGVRLSYIPSSFTTAYGVWLAEEITPIATF